MANDPSLMALADMLKRVQSQRSMENNPQSVHIAATAPSLPAYQASPSMMPPMSSYMKPQASPPAPPAAPPPPSPQVPMNPPPTVAPGNQAVPPMPPPQQVGPQAMDPSTPGFWERLNMANKAQQVPNYGMAMGQPLQNV